MLMEDVRNNFPEVTENYNRFVNHLLDFLDRESNERPKRINLFTTNYDLNFEHAFDDVARNRNAFFNDGGAGFIDRTLSSKNYFVTMQHSGVMDTFQREISCINLLKMHGSISWKKDGDRILIDYPKGLSHKRDGPFYELFKQEQNHPFAHELSSYSEEIEKKNKAFNGEKLPMEVSKLISDMNEEAASELHEYAEAVRDLPIINPDKWKFRDTVLEQHYYQTIRLFSYEMEKPHTVLIIFGFSFADEHILEIFRRSLNNPTLKVILICHSEEAEKRLNSKIGETHNIDYYPAKGNSSAGDFKYLNSLFGD